MAEAVISNHAIQLVETDEDAIEVIVHEHARLVYRITYSVLRNHHDAEDAVQETFIRVLRHRRKLQEVRDQKAWLAQIAWRVAVEKDRKPRQISLGGRETESAVLQLRSQLASAEESAIGKEVSTMLDSLVSALPAQLRDAIRLSTVEELTPSEVAKMLGTSESSVDRKSVV